MFVIVITDTSEIQVLFPFEIYKNEKGVVLMRKSEKYLYSIIHRLLIIIFILLTIIIFK